MFNLKQSILYYLKITTLRRNNIKEPSKIFEKV